ncbi:hypothetical protein SDRG_00775 [Saprolegnia diclina VS20]|uniref:Uncharacterized protein n=1 Tax=Saprolegnia diclina (strain VS20) TaxID=1156394 RepID=T0R659_SAPDV|nr:hypothetical protein SDRG_00775 [Saprolegnia diclina VS20]EQC41920.1 hypothetical protein SDRG_00775 [Saprolegnia diclina VS20]|eukprot:XP_008604489.1 hypothetical protein SDRG_00775 [Saprolegnia diclina VS20]
MKLKQRLLVHDNSTTRFAKCKSKLNATRNPPGHPPGNPPGNPPGYPPYVPPTPTRSSSSSDWNLKCKEFSGQETYPGLGSDFPSWLRSFEDAIAHNKACRTFGYYDLVIRLGRTFKSLLSPNQAAELLKAPKPVSTSWLAHLRFYRHVQRQFQLPVPMVIRYFVNHACPERAETMKLALGFDNEWNDFRKLNNVITYLTHEVGTGVGYKTPKHAHTHFTTPTPRNRGSRGGGGDDDKPSDTSPTPSNPRQMCASMEAEYIGACTGTQEALWIKQLLNEIKMIKTKEPVNLWVDNQSALKTMEDQVSSTRAKHIDIKYHFIRNVGSGACA